MRKIAENNNVHTNARAQIFWATSIFLFRKLPAVYAVFAIIISSLLWFTYGLHDFLGMLVLIAGILTVSIFVTIIHEFSHMAVAYSLAGEGVLWGFKVSKIGAVKVIYEKKNLVDEDIMHVAIAGPAVALIVGIIFIPLLIFSPEMFPIWLGGNLSSIFSLVPFGRTDGQQILELRSKLNWTNSDIVKASLKSVRLVFGNAQNGR